MASQPRTDVDWTFRASSSSSLADPHNVSAATADVAWTSAVQRGMIAAAPHPAGVWDQLLDQRTGTGNSSEGGVTSRVETDDNANWTKEGDSPPDNRSAAPLTLAAERPEVTSETTGSHVFSDIDYHVLRRHVMQGDVDDHVITGDRKSLDSRELTLDVT